MSSDSESRPSTRIQLLNAAGALMTERRTVEISLSAIAERSGLNSALVRYHFGSKQKFLLALLEHVLVPEVKEMERMAALDVDPVEKLKFHMTAIIAIYFRHPYVNRLLHYLLEDKTSARRVISQISKPVGLAQRKMVEDGVAQGLIKPIDPTLLYFVIFGACDHIFFAQQVLKYAFGVETIDDNVRKKYTKVVLDTLLNGMLV